MIEMDTKELEAFESNIDRYKAELKKGWLQYLNYLLTGANVQAKLEKQIKEKVYDGSDNEMYKQTGNLLKSAKTKLEGDELYLYMDDDWLAQTKNANTISTSRGSAPNSNEGYAKNVEYDHSYDNKIGHPYTRTGSKFMESTFYEIKKEIKSGKIDSDKILEPLFSAWRRG